MRRLRRRPLRLLVLLGLFGLVGATLSGCSRSGDPQAPAAAPTTTAKAPTTTTAKATTTTAPLRCTPARPAAAVDADVTLPFGGLDRRYRVHVPPSYGDGTTPLPVVFDFHGNGSSAEVQLAYSGIAPVADREGFVVVAPSGQGSPSRFTLLGATATEADDVAFTLAVLDRVEADLCVDRTRVYTTGMSNGGALSSVLACRAGDRFAAVGAVAAMIYLPACDTAGRVAPIIGFMGTGDPVVPFAGGRVNCCGNPTIPAATDTMASFARREGCDAEPTTEQPTARTQLRRFTGCDGDGAVDFYVVEGGGHTWPGAGFEELTARLGPTDPDLPATELQWAFFRQHRLTSP